MSDIKISSKDIGDITRVKVVGRIDVQQMLHLRTFFKKLEDKGKLYVALDMDRVTFIDSYGVSVLSNFVNRVKLQDGWMAFFNCHHEVLAVLNAVGVNHIIPVFDTFEELKTHFSG